MQILFYILKSVVDKTHLECGNVSNINCSFYPNLQTNPYINHCFK